MTCYVCDKFLTNALGGATDGGRPDHVLDREPLSSRYNLAKIQGAKLCIFPCGHVFHTKCLHYWIKLQQQHRTPRSKKVDCPSCWTQCDESKINKCDLMALPDSAKASGISNTMTKYIAELLRENEELKSRHEEVSTMYASTFNTLIERDKTIRELQEKALQNENMEQLRRQAFYAEKHELEQRVMMERHDKEMIGMNLSALTYALHSVAGNINVTSALYQREKAECEMLRRKVATLEQSVKNQQVAIGYAAAASFLERRDVPSLQYNSRHVFALTSQSVDGGAEPSSRPDAVGAAAGIDLQNLLPEYLDAQQDQQQNE